MKKNLLLVLLLISKSLAESEMGCSISGLLQVQKSSVLKNVKDTNCTEDVEIQKSTSMTTSKTPISEKLILVKVLHENEEVLIEREVLDDELLCPPFCIEPMNIKEVVTVGELEVLVFIDKLKEKKARLVIDVRESNLYAKGTIPGAINLPFSMLKDKHQYQDEVLKLLGAKLMNKSVKSEWSFDTAQSLLIFGSSSISSEASRAITELLNLGYPASKLLYYRGGVSSWKVLGLSIR
jgi:rhodanese-related sulfurtransferase